MLILAGLFLTFRRPWPRRHRDSDEAFYAEASREMVASGDWLTPYYNYELRFQKPILFYWLVSMAYKAAGVGEAAARVPSALAGFGLAILTYLAGRRWFDATTGFFAATVVATSFGYFSIGRLSLPDLPLAFFIAAATWGLIEGIGSPIATVRRSASPCCRLTWASSTSRWHRPSNASASDFSAERSVLEPFSVKSAPAPSPAFPP